MLALPIVLSILFAAFELCMVLYSYEYVGDVAREATRYAMVRGSLSCTNTPNLTNCNLGPNSSGNPIQTWVQNQGFPLSGRLTASASWLTATTSGSPGTTTWSACGSGTCNVPGNAVSVTVNLAFPLTIPFWRDLTFNLKSTSQMIISQ